MSDNPPKPQVTLSDDGNATFLLRWRGRQEGPFTATVIEAKLAANQIGMLHEIAHEGQWVTLRDYFVERETVLRAEAQAREKEEKRTRELAETETRLRSERLEEEKVRETRRQNDLLQRHAEAAESADRASTSFPAGAQQANARTPKSRVLYIVLGLFLGLLGIHNFYAGYAGKAVVQLLITVLAGWLVVPLIVVGIWIVLEIITITQDADGVRFQ